MGESVVAVSIAKVGIERASVLWLVSVVVVFFRRKALASDYAAMLADDVMLGDALPFDRLMRACAEVAPSGCGRRIVPGQSHPEHRGTW